MSVKPAPVVVPAAVDVPRVLAAILPGYALATDGDHGPRHWARVMENGLLLAGETGADPAVVAYFALFHDARRENENDDGGHGARGARLACELRSTCVVLGDEAFERLEIACRDHTRGDVHADPTIQACWDADRLDLGRVGIRPDPLRLGSDAARRLLPDADRRACGGALPGFFARDWAPALDARRD